MDIEKAKKLATGFANAHDADVLFYNGPIARPFDTKLFDLLIKQARRKNVMLILCTSGGDPSAAYRIARFLQKKYDNFTIVIGGWCKSAGTLLAIGAHELIMSDHAELGPLDVQIGRKDELWENDSGLTVLTAIAKLEEKCFELFESSLFKLKIKSEGRITLKTATDLAQKLAIGTIAPIVSQIDPMHVGEVTRAMNIGLEYAKRLANTSRNIDETDIAKLANEYPTHGFVIDKEEASELFTKVREPSEEEAEIIKSLGSTCRRANDDSPIIMYLSDSPAAVTTESVESSSTEKAEANDESNRQGSDSQRSPEGSAGTEPTQEIEPAAASGGSVVTDIKEAVAKRAESSAP